MTLFTVHTGEPGKSEEEENKDDFWKGMVGNEHVVYVGGFQVGMVQGRGVAEGLVDCQLVKWQRSS